MIPHNADAEKAVIGSMLIDPDVALEIGDMLTPRDFYISAHQWIYWAIMQIAQKGDHADYVSIVDVIEQRGKLDDIGGAGYITGLFNATPSALGVRRYAEIVARTAYLRRVIQAAQSIAQLGYEDDGTDIADKQAQIEKMVLDLSPKNKGGETVHISRVLGEVYDHIQEQAGGGIFGVETGFHAYDSLLGGLNKSDLIIVAARPSMGKTALMLNMAYGAATNGYTAAIFSLEMSARQLAHRLIAHKSGIDSSRLRVGQLQDDEWSVFIDVVGQLSGAKMYVNDTPNASISQIRAQARKLAMRVPLDVIFIDYLQLMQSGKKYDNRVNEVAYLSAMCKGLARELDIPVVVGSQLSRACEQRNDKRPMLSDLRDSGAIEQDADVVSFIYRDVLYNPDSPTPALAEIITAKHRNGKTGTVHLAFVDKTASFRNLDI